MNHRFFLAGAFTLAAASALWAQTPPRSTDELPISVSSANYAETSLEELRQLLNEKDVVDPAKPPSPEVTRRHTFIFMPGEIFIAFPSFQDVCRRLQLALAQAGFDNAADAQDRVPNTLKIDLVLRISYGQREWRVPAARVSDLQFRDGLVTRPGINRIVSGGAETAFDFFAGGNDEAIGAIANTGSGAFSNGPGNFAQSGSAGVGAQTQITAPAPSATDLTDTRNTRDYNIIVVDAFLYDELKTKGRAAKRVWTTFIASPIQVGTDDFDKVLDRMIRTAVPYFGRTTRGIQFYRDARVDTTPGPLRVLEVVPESKK